MRYLAQCMRILPLAVIVAACLSISALEKLGTASTPAAKLTRPALVGSGTARECDRVSILVRNN